jgi:hypothetical protein
MKYEITPSMIAERDRCWAFMRQYKSQLRSLLIDDHTLSPFDFILFFQSLALVLTDITIYQEDFMDDLNEEDKQLIQDNSSSGIFQRIVKEKKYWQYIENETYSANDRLAAIKNLRKSLWGNISYQKNDLAELMISYPVIDGPTNFSLLLQCIGIIIMELDLCEKELQILGIDDFPEK